MILPDSNPGLRRALNLKNYTPEQHRIEIDAIRETHSHTIRFIAERADETCVPYALRLTDDTTYRASAGHCNVFAGRKFMVWATEHLKEIPALQSECLICYFSASGWQHVGVITAPGRVTSKWGTYPRDEHGLAEVSEEYGDCVKFYERPSPEDALSLFKKFAHDSGLSDDDIAEARSEWSY
jgi:hypothetical protein